MGNSGIIFLMSYRVEKKVGERVYVYEATNHWDSQKQQSRQTRTYLGRKDPVSGTIIPPHHSPLPRCARDYGNFYVLQQLAVRSGVSEVFQKVFPEDASTLLALAIFEICDGTPLYLFPYWVETTAVDGMKALSPPEITTLTQRSGRMEHERDVFFQQWIAHCRPVQTSVFDITSLSSYSTLIPEVEWGYNRDHDPLPQVNLGVVYHEEAHLPLYSQMYPGSIRDVSTLSNMLSYLDALGLNPNLFIMDRGFYSAANVAALTNHEFQFLVPLPKGVSVFTDLLAHHDTTLTDVANSFLFQDEILCHVSTSIPLNMTPLSAHLFFNPASHHEQTQRFFTQLWRAEAALSQQTFQNPQKARRAMTAQLRGAASFFRVTQTGEHVNISRDALAVTQRLAAMGTTIFLTNQPELERSQVLQLYRQKDAIEKTFATLKHECDGQRMRGHSTGAILGRLFLKFLSLIIYSTLTNALREDRTLPHYSVRELLYELKKLRRVELINGKHVLTEISKRQKDIFKALDLDIPKLKS
jgi:transposase